MRWQQEYVERLVRPTALREREKDRLREELWGHLDALYEEELSLGAAEPEAQRAACRKLGAPVDLASAFDRAAGLHDRIERFILRASKHGSMPYKIGIRRAACVVMSGCMALLCLAASTVNAPGMSWGAALLTWITVSMLLVPMAGFAEIFLQMFARFEHDFARPILAPVALAGAFYLAAWLAGLGASALVCEALNRQDLHIVFRVFSREVYLPACLLSAALGLALGWAAGWRERRCRRLPDWPYGYVGAGPP